MRCGVFGGSDRRQTTSLFTRRAPECHDEEQRSPEERVDNTDRGEHADTLQPFAFEPFQQLVEVAVLLVVSVANDGRTSHCSHHSSNGFWKRPAKTKGKQMKTQFFKIEVVVNSRLKWITRQNKSLMTSKWSDKLVLLFVPLETDTTALPQLTLANRSEFLSLSLFSFFSSSEVNSFSLFICSLLESSL